MSIISLVSILIPAYNHEKYIKEAIQSAINQTYSHIELIIIDDGSKDRTWDYINELIAPCEARFIRVVFETQANQGTCLTLNRLLSLAEGEFVQILASDDKLPPESTAILYDFLSQHPDFSLVVGRNKIIDQDSRLCYWDKQRNNVYNKSEAAYLSFSDLLNNRVDFSSDYFGSYDSLLVGNYIPNGYLIRANIFNLIGAFTPLAPLEDYWLMLQIAKHAKMKYIDKTTFYYRWHGANTVSQQTKMFEMVKKTIDYEIELVKNSEQDDIKQIMADFLPDRFKTKNYFNIPHCITLFKRNVGVKRELVLRVFNMDMIIHTKTKQ